MTKFYFVFLLLLSATLSLAAQQPGLRTYEIRQDSLPYTKLEHSYWQMLADPTGHLSLGQVQKIPFQPAGSDSLRLSGLHGKQVYWLRYQIKNTLSHPVRIVWPRLMNRADVYVIDHTGHWASKATGSGIPWSAMPDQRQFSEIVMQIGAGQMVQVYERQQFYPQFDDRILSAGIRIGNDPPRRLEDYYEMLLNAGNSQAFIGGFVLLAAIITLFFYIISREKLYLYFSLFGIIYGGATVCLVVFSSFFREYPQLQLRSMLILPVCAFLLWRFLALFYRVPEYFPRWHRINVALSWIFLLLITLWYCTNIPFAAVIIIMRIVTALFFISAVLSLFLGIFRKGEGRSKRLVTALPFLSIGLCYICFGVLLVLLHVNTTTQAKLADWGGAIITLCFLWMVCSFLWSLIGRYQYLQKQVLQETLEREKMAIENEKEKLALMAAQKVELEKQVNERTAELKQSLTNLKLTQDQLIQSEKMASLGELTAGIAHEIQNPLNFVNNFSEVSIELLDELKEEATAGHTDDVLDIAGNLSQNLEKINHHGKRADNIVKGMLEHSRTGSAIKEPTDLNKLAEEYLKLSYHGMRSRDKSFNAELISRFDDSLQPVNVVSQDIGRVLLNLFNNAFYAVQQRKKTADDNYKPVVEIQTFATASGGWGATIRDNGIGIPENIKSKIMQPFFTTKPTGEGTGLGLSLSYDILVKGHNGSIDIQSAVGGGAVFTITLP